MAARCHRASCRPVATPWARRGCPALAARGPPADCCAASSSRASLGCPAAAARCQKASVAQQYLHRVPAQDGCATVACLQVLSTAVAASSHSSDSGRLVRPGSTDGLRVSQPSSSATVPVAAFLGNPLPAFRTEPRSWPTGLVAVRGGRHRSTGAGPPADFRVGARVPALEPGWLRVVVR